MEITQRTLLSSPQVLRGRRPASRGWRALRDAAVIVSGTCGFGMGATPNAMANMQAICDKYSPSVKAYLLIPLVGSLFADFLNSLVITVFINFI